MFGHRRFIRRATASWSGTTRRSRLNAFAQRWSLSLEDATNQIVEYVRHYNEDRLHSAIGYIAPKDKLDGRDSQIFNERDQKLEAARKARKQKRLEMRSALASGKTSTTAETINQLTQQPRFSISS